MTGVKRTVVVRLKMAVTFYYFYRLYIRIGKEHHGDVIEGMTRLFHANRMEPSTLLADSKKCMIFPVQNSLYVKRRLYTA